MHAISRHIWGFVEQKCGDHALCKAAARQADRRYNSSMATLRVHVVPNAKIDHVVGEHGGAIKIKLRAPAIEGKANAALRCFLAQELKIPQRSIVLQRGQTSRDKVIRIDGMSEDDVRCRLLGTS
jgi:uncharacterized protein (TIGR00251 family)